MTPRGVDTAECSCVSDPRIEIVECGFDAVAEERLERTTRIEGEPKLGFVDELSRRLVRDARVLELGCGSSEAYTRPLAERFRVAGIDVSEIDELVTVRKPEPGGEWACHWVLARR